MDAAIHERCLRILGEQIGTHPDNLIVGLDDDLAMTFSLDSLDVVELLIAAEEEFEIDIPEDRVLPPVIEPGVRTLRQFEGMVEVLVKDAEV